MYIYIYIYQTTTNQPTEKDKFMLASFSFSPLSYSEKFDDQRTFNSFVRNNKIPNLTRLNKLIARE